MIGQTIGSYRLLYKVGEGGMGVVYAAEDAVGRRAAVKVLHPALGGQPDVLHRFFNEARAVTSLSDPGIVQVLEFGARDGGSAYIAMELLEGESLSARLARRGRLDMLEALRVCRQVVASLAVVHEHGIIHRDLKPENVFLARDPQAPHGERAKLLDFGVAKLTAGSSGCKTNAGALLGTPTYMSPEQCRGAGEVDWRTDIYALGCMLFHLVVGRPPFYADSLGEVILAHLEREAPSPSSAAPGISPSYDALVARCLAKRAADRPGSMRQLAAELELVWSEVSYASELPTRVAQGVRALPPQLAAARPLRPAGMSVVSSMPLASPTLHPALVPALLAAQPAPGRLPTAGPEAATRMVALSFQSSTQPGPATVMLPASVAAGASVPAVGTLPGSSAPRATRAVRWVGALAVASLVAAAALITVQLGARSAASAPAALDSGQTAAALGSEVAMDAAISSKEIDRDRGAAASASSKEAGEVAGDGAATSASSKEAGEVAGDGAATSASWKEAGESGAEASSKEADAHAVRRHRRHHRSHRSRGCEARREGCADRPLVP